MENTNKTANYPALGSRVNYLRRVQKTDENGQVIQGLSQIITGTGNIVSIHLDPDRRVMAQVHDLEINSRFNTPLACINAPKELVDQYAEMTASIDALTAQSEQENRDMVARYNAEIDQLADDVIGKAVEFEAAPAGHDQQ